MSLRTILAALLRCQPFLQVVSADVFFRWVRIIWRKVVAASLISMHSQ